MYFLKFHCKNPEIYKFHCFQHHYTLNKVMCAEKLSEKNQNGQKWLFQIFSDNFSQKNWYKFGTAKNGYSKFFLTIFLYISL